MLSLRSPSPGVLVRVGRVWSPQAFRRTMGTGIGEADEISGEAGDRVFEEVEDGMSGGKGEEEGHVESHRVQLEPLSCKDWGARGVRV